MDLTDLTDMWWHVAIYRKSLTFPYEKKNGAATLKVLMAQQGAMGGVKLKVIELTSFSVVAPKMALNTK